MINGGILGECSNYMNLKQLKNGRKVVPYHYPGEPIHV